MTTTEEQFVSENSLMSENPPSQNEVSPANTVQETPLQIKEPETTKKEAVREKSESANESLLTNEEIPQKFRNKDGSANVSALLKSYKALEPLINEKAKWTKEKESLIQKLSMFQDKDPDAVTDVSKKNVELLEQVLEKSTDIEKAKNLIEKFKENPTNETIKELEGLFPYETLKEISLQNAVETFAELKKQQDEYFNELQNYMTPIVEKNFAALQNPVAAEIFGQAVLKFGSGLDSEWFFLKLQQLKESFYSDFQKEQNLKTEANTAVSTASKMSPNNSAGGGVPLLKRNALDLSPQELDKMLDEYYAK